jgi:hypothetical protein
MQSTASSLKAEIYSYETALSVSEQVAWKIDDVINANNGFDLGNPFLPDSLAKTAAIIGLTAAERRILNQIRGHAYLAISATMKDFTLPFLLDYTRDRLTGDNVRIGCLQKDGQYPERDYATGSEATPTGAKGSPVIGLLDHAAFTMDARAALQRC